MVQGVNFVVELDERTVDRYMDLKLFLEALFGCRVDLDIVWDVVSNKLPVFERRIREIAQG